MLPTIHPNDVVYLQKINFSQIKLNDIVLAQKNKKYFIHRVIYKSSSPQGWYSTYTPGVFLITNFINDFNDFYYLYFAKDRQKLIELLET